MGPSPSPRSLGWNLERTLLLMLYLRGWQAPLMPHCHSVFVGLVSRCIYAGDPQSIKCHTTILLLEDRIQVRELYWS